MIKKRCSNIFVTFLVVFICLQPIPSLAKRAIPSNNLAYPVLIAISGNSTATAFYLRNDINLYLVTAKHVLFTEPKCTLKGNKAICLSYPEDIKDEDQIVLTVDLNSCNSQELIKYHHTHDVVIVHIGTIVKTNDDSSVSIKFNEGVARLKPKNSNIVVASVEGIKAFNDVLISNDVFIFGYPTSIGIKNAPQFEYLRPLLRKGIIAGKNLKKETIILDCPAYYGNSGGPVIEVDHVGITGKKYLLIGVLSQFIPYTETWENKTNKLTRLEVSNSGYSVVTPIDKVLELITQYEKPAEQVTSVDR
jgi:hypothetical protein